jgi:hypothetical protein
MRAERPGWQTMKSAPRDGTLLLLLIVSDEEVGTPLEDTDGPSRTVGFNNFDLDGEDEWKVAGWCWEHDHFTEGRGVPVAWQLFPALQPSVRHHHRRR